MTAPVRAVTLTPELVARFDAYHDRHESWGAFHVSLDDDNWKCLAGEPAEDTDEERELIRLHDLMTPTQRAKLSGVVSQRWRERYRLAMSIQ